MSEFKLHHVVTELLRTLGNDSSSPEEFIEHLQSSINTNKVNSGSHLTIQNHIQTLAQGSSNPQAFLTKFEDLKQKELTITLTALIGNVAGKFSEKLSGIFKISDNKEAINELITNVFFEAANSSSYIQYAFLLLIPVLQVGAV